MAQRPTWQGHLRLSLVACPVALYAATSSGSDVHFHLLDKDTHSRIQMVPTDPERGPVDRKDLVRGFEIDKDQYVIVSDEEIRNIRLPSTKMIDIQRFVDASSIDRIYWEQPYYVAPNARAGVDAFVVIREAMRRSGKVGLGRVVISTRERLVALEPRGKGMLVTTLRTHDEVRSSEEMFAAIPHLEPDPQMIEIAEKIIEQMQGRFDPKEFKDRYEDALRALIEEKANGRRISAPPPEEPRPVVNLMEALRNSLDAAGQASPASRRQSAERKAASRRTGSSRRHTNRAARRG